MNFIKKNLCKIISLGYISLLPVSMLYAAQDPNCGVGKICPPINQTSLNGFIKTLLEGALKVGIPLIALAIIYCGFLFVQARGNSEKITKAKDALLYTLIGAAILLGSWAIAQLISDTVLAL
ncbi:hypothetical protein A3A05_01955 [Candidatus Nomurabacteria bacterium RIFCSPLOWO2_01_FULL_41_12]|uniref:TrbC/VIRB2 family protein n=1 Tax=Candidatus Nomurabacteria bacterium RIFCSPLOWO2_01_FULL_41_12 TaxID=1801774 RepID=A0A1F6WWQ0_9BACT|nr:MAG: hypothetical protein A3A05_01955 [Candidatus Nomurabacteria bacterium RIFCSPLOWO2_01_FULL_41_12]